MTRNVSFFLIIPSNKFLTFPSTTDFSVPVICIQNIFVPFLFMIESVVSNASIHPGPVEMYFSLNEMESQFR